MSDDAEWIKVASTTDLEDNTGYESDVEIDGQNVGVFKIDGRYFALGNCPHEQGPLSQGIIESGRITCPWHSATFEISTGNCLSGPTACRVEGNVLSSDVPDAELLPPCTTYETKVENGDIFVRART